MSSHPRWTRHLAALFVMLVIAGCAATPSPSASSSPATAASPVASGAASSPTATAKAEPSVRPAAWSDCGKGFQCAAIRVPRDYTGADGGTLDVSLIRMPATTRSIRIGSLIVNPGGPGASGVEFVRENADFFPESLRQQFDIVGFDPRGVNSSSGIRCIDNLDGRAALDPSPDDAAELEELVEDARAYSEACATRNAATLPYLSTDAVARDLDLIRMAVGDELLTYLGFSYGTLIGSQYAELFPERIRAMALDGGVDPSIGLERFRSDQATAFEAALKRFLTDCAKRRQCAFHEGGRTARAFDALMASIDAKDLPTPRVRDRRSVGPGLAQSAVLAALYAKEAWPTLAASLALAKQGDGSLMILLADPFRGRKENGSYSNQIDAYTANTCLDFPAPTDVAEYTGWADALTTKAPHFAQHIAYNDLACAFWPVPATRTPAPVSAAGAPPIVVVGSTGDPATPYAWSVALAKQLETGSLVTRKGEGHTAFSASACVREAVDAYLVDLTVPADGLTCD